MRRSIAAPALLLALAACGRPSLEPKAPAELPDLLLVTLDTTRADATSPEAPGVTPHLEALAARGLRFTQAYATAPSTFPSHASMMSGLYPAGHGVHENGRRLGAGVPLVAERLREKGYATAAFVSGYPLERQYGLDRGFEVYDDDLAGANERPAGATTDRALAWLASASAATRPRFLWVHYYDAHEPYAPPDPIATRFRDDPYRGEVAFVDGQAGRLLDAFEKSAHKGGVRMVVVGDHGEGRGDHGEELHGNLLYQGVMRVPLVVAGTGIEPGVRGDAVSVRQVRPTLLDCAGDEVAGSFFSPIPEPVMAEAMQPYLNYRWQPQVMAVSGGRKLIRSGRLELYDAGNDPQEIHDAAGTAEIPRELARALADYPMPTHNPAAVAPVDDEQRRRLASLGYIASEGAPSAVPANAPRAADMTRLYGDLDRASLAFADGNYAAAEPLFRRIVAEDPGNLMSAVRLAVSLSFLGRERAATASFAAAARIDPGSIEVKHYLALHLLKSGNDAAAGPLLEQVIAAQPDREAALSGLAAIRARQGRLPEAQALYERALPLAANPAPILSELGLLRMGTGDTAGAIESLERARGLDPATFRADLELGVLLLAARHLEEAREALDRVPRSHPGYPMALFKRAQVSVLLDEPDRAERVRRAVDASDAVTRPLIANERLFAPFLAR